MFLSAINVVSHKISATGHPELGLNSTRENRVLATIYGLKLNRITDSHVPTVATHPQYLIPHALITPKEVCPLSAYYSFDFPTSLPTVTNNSLDKKSPIRVTSAQHTREQFSAIFSPKKYAHGYGNHFTTTNLSPREASHGLPIRFFESRILVTHPQLPASIYGQCYCTICT
jgi:hypothetical protein